MRVEGAYNWSDGIPTEGRVRLKSLFDSGKTIAIAYETQSVDGENSIQHCFGYKSLKSYCIDGSVIHEDVFLNAVLGKMWFLDPSPRLGKDSEMQLLNLAIAYGDANYQQKDGADRAWHHVAEAREKLIAFVENREPELDDEY